MKLILGAMRYAVLLAVFGSVVVALTLLVCGVVRTGDLISGAMNNEPLKTLALEGIVVVDAFLLGTVFLIIALGLYALFIDDTVPVPEWLEIHTLDDLKIKLVNVVVVVLAVTFLGFAIGWKGDAELLNAGLAIAAVIGALTYFLSSKKKD